MTHEVIRREEARLLRILEEYPVNGRKTNTGTIKMIRKEIGNMTFRIARKCNVSVNYPKCSIQGKKVVLGEPSILLPTLRYVSFVLEFRIRPLSEDEYVKIKKRNTNYKKNKANGLRIAESIDSADYRSELIYEATIEEDRTKIWDRTDAWEKCNVVNGIGLIDVVLKAGEKDAILEKLDEISGFTPSMEDVAKN